MEFDDEVFFILTKVAVFDVWPKIVYPPQSATFTTTMQPGSLGKGAPTTFAMSLNVINKLLVFLLGPSALVGVLFVTARLPHCCTIPKTQWKCREREGGTNLRGQSEDGTKVA